MNWLRADVRVVHLAQQTQSGVDDAPSIVTLQPGCKYSLAKLADCILLLLGLHSPHQNTHERADRLGSDVVGLRRVEVLCHPDDVPRTSQTNRGQEMSQGEQRPSVKCPSTHGCRSGS